MLYVVYNIHTTKIVHVLNNMSIEMLQLIQDLPSLHHSTFKGYADYETNATNNSDALRTLHLLVFVVSKAKNGGGYL